MNMKKLLFEIVDIAK